MKKNILVLFGMCLFSSCALAMEGQGAPDEQDSSEENIPFLQDTADDAQPAADVARDATGFPADLVVPAALVAARSTPWTPVSTTRRTAISTDVHDEEYRNRYQGAVARFVNVRTEENITKKYQRFVRKLDGRLVKQTITYSGTKRRRSAIEGSTTWQRNRRYDDSRGGGGNSSLSH